MPSYDRALTVFSPDGHLFQVEYALEAGSLTVGISSKDLVVLAVEKRSSSKLQNNRTVRKICRVDRNAAMAFSGLTADARILVNKARLESQSHHYTVSETPSIDCLSQTIAREQQRFTQKGGRRPYGVSCLIAGFDLEGNAKLFLTEPSGACSQWSACAVGRGYKDARKELEKRLQRDTEENEEELIVNALEALLTIADAGQNNMEVAVLRRDGLEFLKNDELKEAVLKAEAAVKIRKEEERRQRELRGEMD